MIVNKLKKTIKKAIKKEAEAKNAIESIMALDTAGGKAAAQEDIIIENPEDDESNKKLTPA